MATNKKSFLLYCDIIHTVIFCPENYPISEYYDELINCYVGKSTDKSYINVMLENEYIDATKFIHNHFFAILPENEFYIDTILDRMKYLIRKYGVNACIIDPYNQESCCFR